MHYTTLYDLSTMAPLNWRSLVIPFGLALAATVCGLLAREKSARYGLFGFAAVAVAISVGIPYWDHQQLRAKLGGPDCHSVAGVVTGYWEKEWTERHDGKNHYYSYEAFRVDTVTFGYFRNVEMASFTNSGPASFPLRNGLLMRVHYVPERQLDDGTILNRIVKLDVQQP